MMTFTELIHASSFFVDIGKHTEDIDVDPIGDVEEVPAVASWACPVM